MQKNGKRSTMSKSSKTLLITGGCSFTDSNLEQYIKLCIDAWPEVVADFMDWDLLNAGKGGGSNGHIFKSVIDAINENRDKNIVVMLSWTNPQRLSVYGYGNLHTDLHLSPNQKRIISNPNLNAMRIVSKQLSELREMVPNNKVQLEDTFRYIWLLNYFCEKENIKIINGKSLNFFRQDDTGYTKDLDSIEYYNLIKDYFDPQFPACDLHSASPTIVEEYVIKPYGEDKDFHPNQKGHDLIAHRFIQRYREKYE